MKISIEIHTENSAFGNDPGEELACILRKLADNHNHWRVGHEFSNGIRDTNGNVVGSIIASQETSSVR